LNPQLHASDTRTIIENLKAKKDVLATAKIISDGKEIYISPVTLHKKNETTGNE